MTTKEQKYEILTRQVESLIDGEDNTVGILANVAALLHSEMGWWWTGFYIVDNDKLKLGPFQGPVACFSIPKGKGVCGKAWLEERTIIVPDVSQFPGHIACSNQSKSEIVVPIRNRSNEIIAVLDIDSKELSTFDDTDALYLAKITSKLAGITIP